MEKKNSRSFASQLWNRYFDPSESKGICLCCRRETIFFTTFHKGHIIPRSFGGKEELDNLRPICSPCNLSMGAINMKVYMKNNNYPIDEYFNRGIPIKIKTPPEYFERVGKNTVSATNKYDKLARNTVFETDFSDNEETLDNRTQQKTNLNYQIYSELSNVEYSTDDDLIQSDDSIKSNELNKSEQKNTSSIKQLTPTMKMKKLKESQSINNLSESTFENIFSKLLISYDKIDLIEKIKTGEVNIRASLESYLINLPMNIIREICKLNGMKGSKKDKKKSISCLFGKWKGGKIKLE